MPTPTRKLIYLFDWPLFFNALILFALGLVNLYSATYSMTGEPSPFFTSQIQWGIIGFAVMALMLSFHYRRLEGLAWPAYMLVICLLLAVIFLGKEGGGQRNWLALGPFRMQPSEFAKLAVVLVLARYFSRHPYHSTQGLKALWAPLAIVGLPLALILLEKDIGSAVFFVLIVFSFLFLIGIPKRYLVGGMILLGLVGALGYQFFLNGYQKDRIQSFLHPEKDPQGRGYHLIQSKIAVGSGQIMGKGYLEGHLNKFKFLPERHTDFVFPVLAEEWGFLGGMLCMGAFAFFFLLLLHAAGKVGDPFGSLIISGIAAWLFWQWVLNIGGVLGLLPLAGVTLPFFSYGGSALMTNFLALGIVLNIHMRRYVF